MAPRITCRGCDNTWTGTNRAHCAGCHHTFNSVRLFDRHRANSRCRHPTRVGLTEVDGIWREPATPTFQHTTKDAEP